MHVPPSPSHPHWSKSSTYNQFAPFSSPSLRLLFCVLFLGVFRCPIWWAREVGRTIKDRHDVAKPGPCSPHSSLVLPPWTVESSSAQSVGPFKEGWGWHLPWSLAQGRPYSLSLSCHIFRLVQRCFGKGLWVARFNASFSTAARLEGSRVYNFLKSVVEDVVTSNLSPFTAVCWLRYHRWEFSLRF